MCPTEPDFTILQLYNSDGQQLEAFRPRRKDTVQMYCCGPTVYGYAHIGNLRAYTVQDILRRCLLALGYRLNHVLNITDVGHLTDDGNDKMLLSASAKGKSVRDIADYYTDAFFRDCAASHIAKPEIICRATDHIADMQELIARLEASGYTYYSNGNLYFDTGKLGDYGRLAGLSQIQEEEVLSRTGTDSAKKNQRDFVLWFSNGKFADQAMQWDSPWGRGYPGWHIECSAMAGRFLGAQIDIHCGGVDHKTVHHSNEIAQSESILAPDKKPWVKFWLHNEFVVMKEHSDVTDGNVGHKISKSSGAAITLSDLQDKGFSPLDYRYFLLGSHYRSQIQFHFQAMEGARKSRKRLQQKAGELQALCGKTPQLGNSTEHVAKLRSGEQKNPHMRGFLAALLQDLNTARGLASLWNAVKDNGLSPQEKFEALEFGESFLQIGLFEGAHTGAEEAEIPVSVPTPVPQEYLVLLARRDEARKSKDYTRADQLRNELSQAGYQIIDTAEGPILEKQNV
ncbi:cysteine--tRNA ligase [Candidatus Haliotispira prima]|uniref:Cysteine--tRNA ligase n=1 Tax=Candidatus Haliotispira prima TaxID=3034016 RepID=A0ABY8MJA1_9SPIO|nr:cysteine--tRNA ligase [Candidatus Haliotispira prima]